MAVPFYVPDHDDGNDGTSSSSSQSPNTTSSATQTPLQSPVNGEHLVMAFCEALYRCSINGSPVFQFPPPPSPSCSVHSPGSYTGGDVFFPRGRSTPRSPRNSFGDEASFFRQQQQQQQHQQPQQTPRLSRHTTDAARRSRLTSTGEDDNECLSEHETSWDEFDERYDNFTAGRERLQEFNGRIPPRKKKKDIPKPKPKPKEQSFTWPTVVTVFVVAMGCGFLVAR